MKNIIQVFILLLIIGTISSTAKSDTSIRYALCQKNVKKIAISGFNLSLTGLTSTGEEQETGHHGKGVYASYALPSQFKTRPAGGSMALYGAFIIKLHNNFESKSGAHKDKKMVQIV